jgi:hypothetical protein
VEIGVEDTLDCFQGGPQTYSNLLVKLEWLSMK